MQVYSGGWRVIAAVCLVLSACGDDDEPTDVPVAGAPAKKLDDNKAGDACSADKDCGTGTCARRLTMSTLLGTQTQADAPGGYCSFACRLNVDCGTGGLCVGATGEEKGQCLARCDGNNHCREGYRCLDLSGAPLAQTAPSDTPSNSGGGTCRVAPETDKLSSGVAGAMCSSDGDCAGGRCDTEDPFMMSYPGGYCSGRCLADSDCCEGGACNVVLPGMVASCVRKCESDADCKRDGYRCRMGFVTRQCMPGDKPLPDGVAGKACEGDSDCGGVAMGCMKQTPGIAGMGQTPLPGGYCTQRCGDNSDCGAGAICSLNAGGAFAVGLCYKTCAAVSECRDGYACRSLFGMLGGQSVQNVCAPPTPTNNRDAGADAG